MRKFLIIIFLFVIQINYAQNIRKIKITIVPTSHCILTGLRKHEIARYKELKVIIWGNRKIPGENYVTRGVLDTLKKLRGYTGDKIVDKDIIDYRIKMVIKKWIGWREVVYFDRYGFVVYKRRKYSNDFLKKKLMLWIPEMGK